MGVAVVENVLTLLAAIIGLLLTLFKYIETPKRGWFYISVFFLTHLLSDYYWTMYTLVMGEDPDVSAVMAYFGWNVAYVFLLLAALSLRPAGAKRYWHPLMFLPVPLNLAQFFLYISYGGIINNIWEGVLLTATACVSLQVFLHYLKNKDGGAHFPWTHTLFLLFIISEYGMWTSSCFTWNSDAANPYYYFAFAGCALLVFFGWAAGKDYAAEGFSPRQKGPQETRFRFLLQIIVTTIIFFGCGVGYHIANMMKKALPKGAYGNSSYGIIAVTLFVISIIFVALILMVIFMTELRFKRMENTMPDLAATRWGRFNFVFTIIITLFLMVISVVYTSRLFYRVSVTGVLEDGQDRAASTATELENYLGTARSILWVTADTIDLMIHNGATQEELLRFIREQTDNQAEQFDENFTGLYAYINGEYMDGAGWEPPEGYDATTRDWYKAAVAANGKTIIVSPYVDAQTGSVVLSFVKLLDDGGRPGDYDNRKVAALDMVVNHVQEVIEKVDIDGKGYAMVISHDGLVIAHPDKKNNGKMIDEVYGEGFMDSLVKTNSGTLDAGVLGEDSTLFVDRVLDQWYVVIEVSDAQLFKEIRSQLFVNIIVSLGIFFLISFFYYLGYKNEQINSRKVEELRTVSLKQEYEAQVLKQKESAAAEANRAKSRFLADMSHEIRTPINAILGMNEMVLRESQEENVLAYSKNIRVSGRNLLQIINSILDFSKIEDGKMEIVPAEYNTGDMVTYLVNSIRERAKEKKLELVVNIDPALPRGLYGDDARINQVIMNLLTNAVKYTPEGSVTLTMQARRRQEDKALIYVEVRDTGIGIKESDMGKLFASFERLDLQKNRNIEGTGLGMSITSNLLRLMDSELKVDSTYGEGSVFCFELWQGVVDETPIGEYEVAYGNAEEEIADGTLYAPKAHILIVDDTRMNLFVAENLLKRTAIHIDTATGGEEAVALAEKNVYDVILLDQRMPKMDGTQTLAAIRGLSNENADAPVICLTADAIRGAKERLMAEGFTDYLSKPVDGRTLEEMLLVYLPKEKVEMKEEGASGSEAVGGVSPEADVSGSGVVGDAAAGGALSDTPGAKSAMFTMLERAGIETAAGLSYSAEDEFIYREVLGAYASEAKERRGKLSDCFAAKDWENYAIYIHSLKSSSKTIGAKSLSEAAAALEKAANDKNEEILDLGHDDVMRQYEELVAIIFDSIGDVDHSAMPHGKDVLEFLS